MVATLSQAAVFEKVRFQPHAGQRPILKSDKRFKVVAAGRRFGKSEMGGNDLIPLALVSKTRAAQLKEMGKRDEYWIVGPEYSDSEKEFRVLWNGLRRLEVPFDKPGSYNNPLVGDLHISLWDGAFQVHGKSAKHPETLVGEGLRGVILGEAAKLKERVWTKFIRPTLGDHHGFAWMTSTPEGKNWFYDMWKRGQDPKQRAWDSWRRPAWMNPYVYPMSATDASIAWIRQLIEGGWGVSDEDIEVCGIDPEIAQLLMDLTETMFNQEIGADFSEFVGKVFGMFDEEVHVRDLKFNPGWETYGAVDYGFTNPNVWLLVQIGPWGEIHILDEVYERGLSPEDFADEIARRGLCPTGTRAFYPDPSSPGDTAVLENHLKVKSKPNTGGELKFRLDAIRKALRPQPLHLPDDHPDKQPLMLIDRKCRHSIDDFSAYRYPKTRDEQDKNAPENPMKVDDHAPEAMGRLFAGHFGITTKRHARQSVAQMG